MSSEKDKQFTSYWGEKRKAGRWLFAFRQGLLLFSWPVFFGSELFKYLTRRADYQFSWNKFLSGFMIWTSLGFIAFGLIMWWTHEKRYQNILKKESE
jgi:hypothetical protein